MWGFRRGFRIPGTPSFPESRTYNSRPMTPGQSLALVASVVGAGVMNAMAGGGTILTFPSLVLLG